MGELLPASCLPPGWLLPLQWRPPPDLAPPGVEQLQQTPPADTGGCSLQCPASDQPSESLHHMSMRMLAGHVCGVQSQGHEDQHCWYGRYCLSTHARTWQPLPAPSAGCAHPIWDSVPQPLTAFRSVRPSALTASFAMQKAHETSGSQGAKRFIPKPGRRLGRQSQM